MLHCAVRLLCEQLYPVQLLENLILDAVKILYLEQDFYNIKDFTSFSFIDPCSTKAVLKK